MAKCKNWTSLKRNNTVKCNKMLFSNLTSELFCHLPIKTQIGVTLQRSAEQMEVFFPNTRHPPNSGSFQLLASSLKSSSHDRSSPSAAALCLNKVLIQAVVFHTLVCVGCWWWSLMCLCHVCGVKVQVGVKVMAFNCYQIPFIFSAFLLLYHRLHNGLIWFCRITAFENEKHDIFQWI